MFSSARKLLLGSLIKEAKAAVRNNQPIPLNVRQILDGAGIDLTELERNTRNGA